MKIGEAARESLPERCKEREDITIAAKSRAASQKSPPKKPIEREQTPPSYASVKRQVMQTMQDKGIGAFQLSQIMGPRLGIKYASVHQWLGQPSKMAPETKLRYTAAFHAWLNDGAPSEVASVGELRLAPSESSGLHRAKSPLRKLALEGTLFLLFSV